MADIEPAAFRQLVKELTQLSRSPPEGIRMILNEDTMTDVQAWIRGPEGTPYEGGYFRVKLVLKNEFPRVPPIGLFETKIFHPNVSSQGEICVNTLKKDWQPKLGIRHVLLTIKCLLIAPNPESALNEEAGRQLLERYEDYAKHARMMTYIHARNNSGRQAFESDEDTPTTASTSQRCGESEECTTMDESGEVSSAISSTTTSSTSTSTSSSSSSSATTTFVNGNMDVTADHNKVLTNTQSANVDKERKHTMDKDAKITAFEMASLSPKRVHATNCTTSNTTNPSLASASRSVYLSRQRNHLRLATIRPHKHHRIEKHRPTTVLPAGAFDKKRGLRRL